MRAYLAFVLIASAVLTTSCSAHYTEADVSTIETNIRSEFEQKGFIVDQVSMIKDSERHMTGFAKVHKTGLFLSKLQVTKNCNATLDADSGRSIWECK